MSQCCREDEPLVQNGIEGKRAEVLNPIGQLSFQGAAFILFCTAVGAGVVAVPRAFSFSGWAAGMLVLVATASLTSLSLSCLFKCAQMEHGSSTYQSLVQKHLPAGLSYFVQVTIAMLLLGAIGTMLLLAMHVWQSVELAVGVAPLSPSHMPWALLVLESLICLPRNFTELQGVTIANLCATLSVVLLVCIESSSISNNSTSKTVQHEAPGFSAATSLTGLLAALPMILYAFFCQIQAPQLYSELQPSARRNAPFIGAAATAACFLVYACVGLLGYAAFGAQTESDILAQLTKLNPSSHWLCLGQVMFGMVLVLSTPLVLAPLRAMLLSSFVKDSGNFLVHTGTTASILALAMTIALSVPGVDFIMGILGATCVVFLALIVPGLLTVQCCGGEWRMAGWILIIAGSLCTPLTFGAFVAKHLGQLPR